MRMCKWGGEFDMKFCNGGEFCMRVRERERE